MFVFLALLVLLVVPSVLQHFAEWLDRVDVDRSAAEAAGAEQEPLGIAG
jgi:hypothetical protein